mgnify:CR=1 FL=1
MDKILKIGIIGCGGIANGKHMPALQKVADCEMVAFCDIVEERAVLAAKEFGTENAAVYTDYRELLKDKTIDVVHVCTPNRSHSFITVDALEAGKHVMCEKPMGDTLEEATRLIKLKQELNGFLQIGFELHYSRLYMKAKEWIDQGLIGKVVNIQTRYLCTVHHAKGSWRSKGKGSFLIGEKLSHYLDLQRWFMGSEPDTVFSVTSPRVLPYVEYHDNHNITTRFKNGGVGD